MFQEILCNQSRQAYAAAFRTSHGQEGGRGATRFFVAPRRLCAAFDARKRLPGDVARECPGGFVAASCETAPVCFCLGSEKEDIAQCPFSSVRKDQRTAGASNLPPPIAAPDPRLLMVRGVEAILLRNGLAGAYCSSMTSLHVGAPLPCTASRRLRNSARLCVDIIRKRQIKRLPLEELDSREDGTSASED